jgi:hypothetical protein
MQVPMVLSFMIYLKNKLLLRVLFALCSVPLRDGPKRYRRNPEERAEQSLFLVMLETAFTAYVGVNHRSGKH